MFDYYFPRSYYIGILLLFNVCVVHAQHLNFRQLTVENGLSQNAVMSITQDQRGFMWYGTRYGLNRYDGIRFKVYKSIPGNKATINDNIVNALLSDGAGTLWAGTSAGLCRYNDQADAFEQVALPGIPSCYVSTIYEDDTKQLWIGTDYGLLRLADKKTNRFERPYPGIALLRTKSNMVRCIYKARNGTLWVGTSKGLACLDQQGRCTIYNHNNQPGSLTADYITSITEDNRKRLWIGTLHDGLSIMETPGVFTPYRPATGTNMNSNIRKILPAGDGRLWVGTQDGINIIDPATMQALWFGHDPENKTSLSNNSVHSLYQDKSGTIWAGTYHGGINLLYAYTTPFNVYQNNRLPSSISSNVISSIVEDDKQNLWIGTEGGGLNYFNRLTGAFSGYTTRGNDSNSISSNLVKVVYKDHDGQIWIGTSYGNGLNLYHAATGTFQRIALDKQVREAVNFDEILTLLQTNDGTLWIGAQSGLTILQRNANGSYPSRTTGSTLNSRLANKNIHALYEDSRQHIWIGTGAGLALYNPVTHTLVTYLKKEGDTTCLQADAINCITEDSKGNIWAGTFYGGLSKYNMASKHFTTYTDKQGLPNNNVLGIVEDAEGNLWLSTDNGLAKFNPQQTSFKTYTTSDGIAGNKFNNNSFYKDSKGLLWFGGNNGLTAFYPAGLQTNTLAAPVRFTGLQLSGSTIGIHDESHLLDKEIGFTQEIRFRYDQSNFTIDYALLNFIKPEKNRYAYMLEGIETQWNYTNSSSATYTNLPAGHYTFVVKAANNDGVWTTTPARLGITILPPIWKTWYAYTFYTLVLATIIFFFLRFFWLRELFKKEHDLQQFKLNFFTNISHEIRTHLTLISGPVEKLLQVNKDDTQHKQLAHVKSNADRLMHLVGELMDFRKAETNNLPLHVTQENLVSFTEDIYRAFTDLAQARQMQTSFSSSAAFIALYFDRRQMEKVIFNLLTNAFKFTPDHGEVAVVIQEGKHEVHITISDNGKGIAPEHLKKLFVNFFQVNDDAAHNTGYGIGLALSKSIVELHKGSLTVTSEPAAPGKTGRTSFTVSLRKGHQHFEEQQLQLAHTPAGTLLKPVIPVQPVAAAADTAAQQPSVLLVEDNPELRSFIKESLMHLFTITECVNGVEGWHTAVEQIPDLVISDVMMPEMDGFTLCRQLKEDIRTSHIPVILLTAKAAHESHVAGLTSGADAYITKPFSIQVLELQARNLVAAREAMRLQFGRQLVALPVPPQEQPETQPLLSAADQAFMENVLRIVEEYMDDPEFNVSLLSSKMAMSAPILYKKIKALTDMTVNDFIKSLRFKKAAELLLQGEKNVSEVAYAVGFNRRKYFSEEFKKVYGKTPSEYIQAEKREL
jgi:ligand-binding sensor domain-containing protein/signal transduction histidine kinase/DNA-binding response OmpR family regulator